MYFIFLECIYIFDYPNTTCSPSHHHIDFMATDALGQTHVWFHVAGIAEECSNFH